MVNTRSSGAPLYTLNDRINQRFRRARRWRKMYRPNDTAHRHRIPDRQPKSTRVVSYFRR